MSVEVVGPNLPLNGWRKCSRFLYLDLKNDSASFKKVKLKCQKMVISIRKPEKYNDLCFLVLKRAYWNNALKMYM